jgi:hypothetical protein
LLAELARAIDELRERLDAIRLAVVALPEDERREVITAICSATERLGDLYCDFGSDMLRMLGTLGNA